MIESELAPIQPPCPGVDSSSYPPSRLKITELPIEPVVDFRLSAGIDRRAGFGAGSGDWSRRGFEAGKVEERRIVEAESVKAPDCSS